MLASLPKPVTAEKPRKFEELNQSYGFVLYRTGPVMETGKARLKITELRDFALIMEGPQLLGTLDRRKSESALDISLSGHQPLDILVENMGRINFGPKLLEDRKGITEKVTLNGRELTGWHMFSLPCERPNRLRYSRRPVKGPAFYRTYLDLRETGDTYLDMRGWGKGNVWVNGYNLGRYWKIGPQQALFVPGVWLRKGRNEVIVLDLFEGSGRRSLAGVKDPIWETPPS